MDVDAARRVPFDTLDLATVDEFAKWAREEVVCMPRDGSCRVVLDLADVEFVMAAGVEALVVLEAELRDQDRALGVINAAPIVTRVLEICEVADGWVIR